MPVSYCNCSPTAVRTCDTWDGRFGHDGRLSQRRLCRELLAFIRLSRRAGCSLRAISQAVFAEFERGIIRERVNAGLARAKANGTKLGRRTVKPSVEARIRELKAEGMGILKIGRTLGIGTSVVQRVISARG